MVKTNTMMKDGRPIPNTEEDMPHLTPQQARRAEGTQAPKWDGLMTELRDRAKKARDAKGHRPD